MRFAHRHPASAATCLVLALACPSLAACGSSSSSSSSGPQNASTPAGAPGTTGPRGPGAGRFAALRQCLQKNGINLPQRPAGQRRPPGAAGGVFGGGGARQLPAGVTPAQFQAALAKCGGGSGRRFNDSTYRAALAKFVSCMSQSKIKLPPPNTTGNGPVFNTSKLNVNSPQFKTAQSKCLPLLRGRFSGRAGGSPRPGAGAGATPQ